MPVHTEGIPYCAQPPPSVTKEEMRAKREAWGMTQPEFAKALGVAQPQVSRWEKGERDIPLYIAKLIYCMDREREARS